MTGNPIPDDLRRFLVSRALTVPHVEAILLVRSDRGEPWDAHRLAARLYMAPAAAAQLLTELCECGIGECSTDPLQFRYAPATTELARVLALLDETYSKHLVAITRLIHSTRDPAPRNFAAAFRFRKEP